jgi:hypothetical protein
MIYCTAQKLVLLRMIRQSSICTGRSICTLHLYLLALQSGFLFHYRLASEGSSPVIV